MKRCFLFILTMLVFVSCKKNIKNDKSKSTQIPVKAIVQDVVRDYASFFSDSEHDLLSHKIRAYERISTNQICVYTLDSIPKSVNPVVFASGLANQLGIGLKGKDNGLFILLSKYDRKISIATGYGTEKTITDEVCLDIIENIMKPHFKEDNYYKGVSEALDSIQSKW